MVLATCWFAKIGRAGVIIKNDRRPDDSKSRQDALVTVCLATSAAATTSTIDSFHKKLVLVKHHLLNHSAHPKDDRS
jgi:hypothetical protein